MLARGVAINPAQNEIINNKILNKGNSKWLNQEMMFGITIPRTIGVSALLSAFSMVLYIAWVVAGINSKIDNSVDQIEQTKRELQQLKSEIVTRSELAIQLQSMQRDIDRVNNQMHETRSSVNDLDKELKSLIRETSKR